MIIADSTPKPSGFPYPLLNTQALINFRDNTNIPDNLCGLLLPKVNLIIICKRGVNLWAFKGVACKLWHCCLPTTPHQTHFQSTCQPGTIALIALLGSGMENKCCQIYANPVWSSQINNTEWNQVKSALGSSSRSEDMIMGLLLHLGSLLGLLTWQLCRALWVHHSPSSLLRTQRHKLHKHVSLCGC